jgi:hypothetical protein
VFWWNPLCRAVSAELSRLREQLCDDLAAGPGRHGRRLAEALVAVAEWTSDDAAPVLGATGLLDDGPDGLEERVTRLLTPDRPVETRLSARAWVATLGLAVGLTGVALAVAPRPAEPGIGLGDDRPATARGYDGSPIDPPPPKAPGVPYQMWLPAGFTHTVTLTPVGGNRFRLEPKRLNSSGIYELRGDRLVIVEPNDRRLLGFAWEVRGDGRLVLVDQPPVSKTGSNYLGARLTRS